MKRKLAGSDSPGQPQLEGIKEMGWQCRQTHTQIRKKGEKRGGGGIFNFRCDTGL